MLFRSKLREKIQNITNEYKNKLKELDEKALKEWVETHRSDTSCAICVQEVELGFSTGLSDEEIKKSLNECSYDRSKVSLHKFITICSLID